MPFFNSERGVFLINDIAGTSRNLSQFIVSFDGLPGGVELLDITGLTGTRGRFFVPGLENVQFTAEGWQNTTGTLGPGYVLGSLRKIDTTSTAVAFSYSPDGTVSGEPLYSGSAWVRNFVFTNRVGNAIGWRAEFQVNGTVVHATNS